MITNLSASELFQKLRLALLALNPGIDDQLSHFLLPDFLPFCSLLCVSEACNQESTVVYRLISSRVLSHKAQRDVYLVMGAISMSH